VDFLRRNKHVASATSDDLSVANALLADEYFDGNETEAMLQQAIAQLPEVQRMVFQLRYFDEMKYSDISKLLDTSEGALKASYHIAVKKITEFFKSRD
jgi:RNA polymerase sigma-70 factor (ECF subfamily)